MRPRKTPAENGPRPSPRPSKTPRFNEAAENTRGKRRAARARADTPGCFNEAAENTRGKHVVAEVEPRAGADRHASMRPRKTPAENVEPKPGTETSRLLQ